MRTLFTLIALTALALGPLAQSADAQTSSLDEVRLFQSHFRDAPISPSAYVEPQAAYHSFDGLSVLSLGAGVGVPIQSVVELGAEGSYIMRDIDEVDEDPSGITQPVVYGRYNLLTDGEMSFALGGMLTLPVGSEDIVGPDPGVDFGFFGAGRYLVAPNIGLTGTLGIDLIETTNVVTGESDRETDLVLGLGTVINTSERFNLVGELQFRTESDIGALSGGVDYRLSEAARLRGALLVGLDDRSPEIGIQGGVLIHFGR